MNGWKSYSGILHLHTDKSGGPSLSEIVETARTAGARFVLIADTNADSSEARKNEGWHDDVLVLVAEEICLRDGQFLAAELRKPITENGTIEQALSAVRNQGGAIVGMHHQLKEIACPPEQPAPLPLDYVDLLELWSFQDEFIVKARGRAPIQHHARPEKVLSGPSNRLIREWDEQLKKRSLPAIGVINSFGRKEPLLDWKQYFSGKATFQTIRTHVLCPELPKRKSACHFLWKAIREGHAFIANHALGDPSGFSFQCIDADNQVHDIGEAIVWQGSARMRIAVPMPSEIVLNYNGSPLFWGTGETIEFPAVGPGVYRVEIRADRRTWIITNPIRFVTPGSDVGGKATVVDFT